MDDVKNRVSYPIIVSQMIEYIPEVVFRITNWCRARQGRIASLHNAQVQFCITLKSVHRKTRIRSLQLEWICTHLFQMKPNMTFDLHRTLNTQVKQTLFVIGRAEML